MFIAYTKVDDHLDHTRLGLLREQLPKELVFRNKRFRRLRDQQRNLLGLLLLKWILSERFDGRPFLENLKKTRYLRPYVPGSDVDFNISHAGDFVICAVSSDARVGIDIEKKKEIDFKEYERTMNAIQWDQILMSSDPLASFFEFWCIKESVIKADGRGLSIPLTHITLKENTVSYSGKTWFIRPFKLDRYHFGCLASDLSIDQLQLEKIRWNKLLP